MNLFKNILNLLNTSSRRSQATAAISDPRLLRSLLPSQRQEKVYYTLLRISIITLILAPGLLYSQISISGEITPTSMFRISDGSHIDLPFRLGNISLNYAIGDFELITNTAIETRWKDPEFSADMLQFREAFVIWYPSFGELKLGKMIQAWGAADANNPTDNLSPYDFYYMFLAGTDRKLGNLGLSAKSYWGDWQGEVVFTPEHKGNRLPFDEPDFPIDFPFEPESYEEVESPAEYGLRVQRAFNAADISLSYLKSHDQLFSLLFLTGLRPEALIPQFGYRNTNVIGADFVAFPGNWTLRGEGAFFQTKTPDMEAPGGTITSPLVIFPVEAEYFQYVLQIEYQFANQVSLMGQFLGTEVFKAEGLTTPETGLGVTLLTVDNFRPGLGTPFAMISDQVLMLSSMATLFDNSLELSGMLMVNLAETGYMTSVGSEYSLSDGLALTANMGYFIGGDEEGNSFKQLEDFSNLNLGLTYSF